MLAHSHSPIHFQITQRMLTLALMHSVESNEVNQFRNHWNSSILMDFSRRFS
jgi:hypothetical protein